MEVVLYIALAMGLIFSGLTIYGRAKAQVNLNDRIKAIQIVVSEFERLDRDMTLETGSYLSKIRAGKFGAIEKGIVPFGGQISMSQETMPGQATARYVYFWFKDSDPRICKSMRAGLTSRNGYYYNGFSTILGRYISLECRGPDDNRRDPKGSTIIEMRVPYINPEGWIRGKGGVI